MSTPSTSRGITPGLPTNAGSFKAEERPECGIALTPPMEATPALCREIRLVIDEMVPYATHGGGYTETAEPREVATRVRDLVPHLGDDEFAQHMSRIGDVVSRLSVIEKTAHDVWDTDSYEEIADHYGVDMGMYPVEYPEPDDSNYDIAAFHAAVGEEAAVDLHRAIANLVDGDQALARRADFKVIANAS